MLEGKTMSSTGRLAHLPALPWLWPVVMATAWFLTACGNGGSSHADSPPPSSPDGSFSAGVHQTTPSAPTTAPATGSPSDAPSAPTSTGSHPLTPGAGAPAPGCSTGPVTVTRHPGELAAPRVCVRVGTTVTVILPAVQGARWSAPHTSSPMLATITSATTDPDGTARVTIRAARAGAATVSWGGGGATSYTLRLDVAAQQIA